MLNDGIKYCKKSTITEAWVAIIGPPSDFNEQEVNAIGHQARKSLTNIVPKPSLVLINKNDEKHPAFWMEELSYDEGLFMARVGHQYLSVHTLTNLSMSNKRYTTFDDLLKPQIILWTEIYNKVMNKPSDFSIGRLVFGYTNTFQFPKKDFNLMNYFNINVGIGVGSVSPPLDSLSSTYMFRDDDGVITQVKLDVLPEQSPDELQIKTHVTSEVRSVKDIDLSSNDRLMSEIFQLKEKSKKVFFGFATDKTHKLMEAEYAYD